jgi:hypothetical protein
VPLYRAPKATELVTGVPQVAPSRPGVFYRQHNIRDLGVVCCSRVASCTAVRDQDLDRAIDKRCERAHGSAGQVSFDSL